MRIFEQNNYSFAKIKEAIFVDTPYTFFAEPKRKAEAKHSFVVEIGRNLRRVNFGELSNSEPEKIEIEEFRKNCLKNKLDPIRP